MSKLPKDRYNVLSERKEAMFEGLSTQERAVLLSMAQSQVKKDNALEASDKEQFLTWDIVNTAYRYILEDNIPAKESLTKAANKHKAEIEAVLAEKSKYSGRMSGKIVINNDTHPVQKDMSKKGTFNKQSIKNSKNVWQMLNLLKDFRQAYEDLLKLEEALERISKLEMEMFLVKDEVSTLREIVGQEAKSDKEKAELMLRKGFTQQNVADVLGKSRRTIQYWAADSS